MKQKDIFLQSEGDAWFLRNVNHSQKSTIIKGDILSREIIEIAKPMSGKLKILEIGCGGGERLKYLSEKIGAECCGLEPSKLAVSAARDNGIDVQRGVADCLPFDDESFDMVIFGFCLYLCDREDLFQIASEANRVLRSPGWIALLDFYSPVVFSNNYHHKLGVLSHKMDYRSLFSWHPDYECLTHKVRHHYEDFYTDLKDEWVAVSILRKFSKAI